MSEFNISQTDLESLADTYDKIKLVFKSKSLQNDKSLSKELESHLKMCISELSEKLSMDTYDEILEIYTMQSKFRLYEVCISKVSEFLNMLHPDSGAIIKEIFEKLFEIFNNLLEKAVNNVQGKNQAMIENSELQNELDQVLRAAEGLEQNILNLNVQKHELKEEIERIKYENTDYIEHLEEENRVYLEKIVKSTKVTQESVEITAKSIENKEISRSYSPFRPRSTTPQPNFHDLSLKETKEIIEEILQAKLKFDQKCKENMQKRENLPNFISLYFNQKYGLKSLCNQWHLLLNKALDRYESEIEVKTFKKIKNIEINEEIFAELKFFKEKIFDYIKNYLRVKNQYMHEKNIKSLLEEIVNGNIEDELINFILTLLPGKESLIRNQLFEEIGFEKNSPKKKRICNCKKFIDIMLDCYLSTYESKIFEYVSAFKEVDDLGKGFIDKENFGKACRHIGINKEPEKLFKNLDPFGLGEIVFSDFILFAINEKFNKDESFVSSKNRTF